MLHHGEQEINLSQKAGSRVGGWTRGLCWPQTHVCSDWTERLRAGLSQEHLGQEQREDACYRKSNN